MSISTQNMSTKQKKKAKVAKRIPDYMDLVRAKLPLPKGGFPYTVSNSLGDSVHLLDYENGFLIFDRDTFEMRLIAAFLDPEPHNPTGKLVLHLWIHPTYRSDYLTDYQNVPEGSKRELEFDWEIAWSIFLHVNPTNPSALQVR